MAITYLIKNYNNHCNDKSLYQSSLPSSFFKKSFFENYSMAGKSKFLKNILLLINFLIIAAYLAACIAPFIDTEEYWLLAYPGLVFPLIFFALLIFIIIWVLLKSKWACLSLIVLLAGFQKIMVAFAFNIPKDFLHQKGANTLRVLQWNVASWDESGKEYSGEKSYRWEMIDVVKKQDADILCFEEFFEPRDTSFYKSNILAMRKMGYASHFFVKSANENGDSHSGIAIFSKYPFIDSAYYSFSEDNSNENLLYADIKVNDKIFRIFATHLQSVHFEKSEYQSINSIKHAHKSGLRDSRTIISKLKKGYVSRYNQAELVSEKIKESPYQSLICGDFNDVPNSNTYFKIKGNFQDAFLQKGTWIGRTFRFISPTLRIDYILPDKKFEVTQYQRIKVPYSDHYPVEADLKY